MKFILLGDVHLRDTHPRMCTPDYLFDLFTLLAHAARSAAQREAAAVVIAGDLFDNKIPMRNSHRLVQATIELLLTFPCPIYVVPGNHDMTHDLFESVFDTQPLGVLIRAGAVHLLSEWALSPRFRGESFSGLKSPGWDFPIYGVPWLQEWNHEDEYTRDAAVEQALAGLGGAVFGSPVLVVTHAPFFPPGKESPYESYYTSKFAQKVQNICFEDVGVFYGHIHDYHGIYDVGGVKFANAGALSRGSLHEYNLDRGIFLTEWDSDTGEFEIFPIPHRPASEVFNLDKAEEIKSTKINTDDFLYHIGKAHVELTTVGSVMEHVKSLKLEQKVTKKVQELLEEADK
jgi:DNA repair exonuclease SbcCD nuclease subunit